MSSALSSGKPSDVVTDAVLSLNACCRYLLIRRLKKNVLQDLPAKLRQRVPIEVDPACVGVSFQL